MESQSRECQPTAGNDQHAQGPSAAAISQELAGGVSADEAVDMELPLLEEEVEPCFETSGRGIPTTFTIELAEETVVDDGRVFVSPNCTMSELHDMIPAQLFLSCRCEVSEYVVFETLPNGGKRPMTEDDFQALVKRGQRQWALTIQPIVYSLFPRPRYEW